jgi:hypothetical protein
VLLFYKKEIAENKRVAKKKGNERRRKIEVERIVDHK